MFESLLRTTTRLSGATYSRRNTSPTLCFQWQFRRQSSRPQQPTENLNASHSRFLAEGSRTSKWTDDPAISGNDIPAEDYDALSYGKGKLSPTTSHLFKLILPIDYLRFPQTKQRPGPPTVFLLHPSQPLSHIARLISASLSPKNVAVEFRTVSPKGSALQWSDSTDIGDVVHDAARAREFSINIRNDDGEEKCLQIEVPTFADRTRFLRQRLETIQDELQSLEALKKRCDREAHRGARRVAVGGLGMLVVYWGTVMRLTFWDLGWDIMEPITYLSGLTMAILGYLWFLYQGREVSYSSVLHQSISTRREALYKAHGFDIERWIDLIAAEKAVRNEISKIADDYDEGRWKERDQEREDREEQAAKEIKELKTNTKKAEAFEQGQEH
ncbi:hypothetical protein BDY19DRAFT_112328 [Irpex rosettiformis]|uniref:Uncharacterized protein n=1 Tax=Irpex rosettiformis TaxID=378272 RepID=A0ACB8U5V8_9APHY|nr:hypothetical protein BDY19DRAFT_112328 [Irpex rosettiformis]